MYICICDLTYVYVYEDAYTISCMVRVRGHAYVWMLQSLEVLEVFEDLEVLDFKEFLEVLDSLEYY